MANELMTLEQAAKEIDLVVAKCEPLAMMKGESFSAALAIAESVSTLRQIFRSHPEIRKTIQSMQDSKLGFLTDRSPAAIARAERDGKKLRPYTYDEVAESVIEGLLKGYRITNNEMNIIAGNFYPAKNGKYRKIIEYPGITDFQYATTPPQYEPDGRYAKVQGYASWKKDGTRASMGFADDAKGLKDTQIFKVRVNAGMGEDAVIGKAQSKLFARVLERITGIVLQESTDVEDGIGVIDIKPEETSPKIEGENGKANYEIKTAQPAGQVPANGQGEAKPDSGLTVQQETLMKEVRGAKPGRSPEAAANLKSLVHGKKEILQSLPVQAQNYIRAKYEGAGLTEWPLDEAPQQTSILSEEGMVECPKEGCRVGAGQCPECSDCNQCQTYQEYVYEHDTGTK
jgi:hypothetical protein